MFVLYYYIVLVSTMTTTIAPAEFEKIEEMKKQFGPNQLFTDHNFPPNDESLGKLEGDTAAGEAGRTEQKIYWARPYDICNSHGISRPYFVVVQDGDEDREPFSISDIKQGGLGDCWYIAALQALTTRPNYLQNVIPSNNYNGFEEGEYCGVFQFQFYSMETNEWVNIVVDDLLPCTKDGDKLLPAFAKFTTKFRIDVEDLKAEFWTPLIEKAFAKFIGSYARIEGGFASQALCNFTGGWPEFVILRPDNDQYNFIKSRIKAAFGSCGFMTLLSHTIENAARAHCLDGYTNYIKNLDKEGKWTGAVTCVGYKWEPETGQIIDGNGESVGLGLLGPHSYTVIRAKEVGAKGGGGSYFLLQIRNPHATHEWTGQFADRDETSWALLEQDLRIESVPGSKVVDDGVFWIELNSVLRYFYAVEFCFPRGVGDAKQLTTIKSVWPKSLQDRKKAIRISGAATAEFSEFPAFKFYIKPSSHGDGGQTLGITLVLHGYHSLLTPNPYFGFLLYKHEVGVCRKSKLDKTQLASMFMNENPLMRSPPQSPGRDVSCYMNGLESGTYILVTTLYASSRKLPPEFQGKEIGFTLRVWTEAVTEIEPIQY